ncbi:hypothetical protein WICPIJ_001925 [Wickerhamomyces pijperi]|uniref:Autophagy-related protein 27 n=1 Tax=Wickerhamomyces pijperi TaxID=599730 RepID=A0A9P8TQP2_WICPI|nr:hypothetical protein WICPIJ_001925 [Wickerhamomyces pijperi]
MLFHQSALTLVSLFVAPILAEQYPILPKTSAIQPYSEGDLVPIQCIQRQIDNGEHKFDDNNNIIYGSFPVCSETGKPFSFEYGVSEAVNCTIVLTDEIYHLFQLYLHEDAPFSCHLPHNLGVDEKSLQGFIPFALNLRGNLESSHLDIDTALNVILQAGSENDIVAAVAYSSGSQTHRYIIGDLLTFQFNVHWFKEHKRGDLYALDLGYSYSNVVLISLFSLLGGAALTFGLLYGWFNRKSVRDLGYKPGFAAELGFENKRD